MRRRGLTLVEVLIASVLLAMVTTAVYGIIVLSRDYFAAVRAASEVNQEAVKAALGLERELCHAEPSTIATSSAPSGVRFLSAMPGASNHYTHDANGRLLWRRWVVIALDEESRLVARWQDIAPTTTVPDPAGWPSVSSLASDQQLPSRLLAHDVVALTFPAAPADLFRVAITVEHTASRFPSGRPNSAQAAAYQVNYQAEIRLRNKETL